MMTTAIGNTGTGNTKRRRQAGDYRFTNKEEL
jgi:hypothetical protein